MSSRSSVLAAILIAIVALGTGPGLIPTACATMAGMITPVSGGGDTYVAYPVSLEPGEALAGFRWYNNDGSTPLSAIRIVDGTDQGPDLNASRFTATGIYASSDAWAQLDLSQPVQGASGELYVVFQLPATIALGVEPVVVAAGGVAEKAAGPRPDAQAQTAQALYRTALEAAYPNPANPTLRVAFSLGEAGHARVDVYNVRGQAVRQLLDRWLPVGRHQIPWDGTDDEGATVSSGVYYVRFQANGTKEQTRVTLVR